jgi:intein/homing endonuclease
MEINILQILPDSTFVKCEKDILKNLFGFKVSEISKSLNLSLKNVSRYKSGHRGIPLKIFKQLCTLNNLNLRQFQDKIYLKVTSSGTDIRLGPYLKLNEKWVYVAELIRGDGHIPSNYWAINFVNNESALIDYVSKFFSSLGISKSSTYLLRRYDANFLTIRNFVLAYLFSKIFAIPAGKKKEMHLPKFFFQNESFMKAAVRGAFDAEGSVSCTGSRRISIASTSRFWLEDLQKILEKLRIKSKIIRDINANQDIIYRLLVYHQINLIRFLKIIKPYHPKRKNKLKEILCSYPDKNPTGFWRKKIILAIRDGYVKRSTIAEKLDVDKHIIGDNLWWLQKKFLISVSKKTWTNKGGFYEYKITKKGLSYLNESHSFFD